MLLEEYSKKVSTKVKDNHGITISWEEIFELVLEMLTNCFDNEQEFANSVKTPTVIQRLALNVQVRRHFGFKAMREARKVAESMHDCCDDYTDEQLSGAFFS